jgi:hypothetical protein
VRYVITQAQWDAIDPLCKGYGPDGARFFYGWDPANGVRLPVPVDIVPLAEVPPVDIPPYYVGTWPLDPRD